MKFRIIGDNNIIIKHFENNAIIYIAIMLIFLIGILVGVIHYNKIENKKEISTYVKESITKIIDKDEYNSHLNSKDKLLDSIKISFLIWVLGSSIIGVPVLLFYVSYRGFSLSFTISSLISTYGIIKGNLIGFTMLFIPYLLSIFAIFIPIVSGIRLAIDTITKSKEIKIELIKHGFLSIFCSIFLIASFAIEMAINKTFLAYILAKIQ